MAPGKILEDKTDPSGHKGEQADPDERPHGALPPPAATEHLFGSARGEVIQEVGGGRIFSSGSDEYKSRSK